jgi:hypothetical protein
VLTALSLAGALWLPGPARAWNHTGHMVVAQLAYQQLTPDERARVIALLTSHPDVQMLSGLAGPVQGREYAIRLFAHAARWPDLIRDDARFYDDADARVQPTPRLEGFPDMKKHKPWHFKDDGFSTDGTSVGAPDPANAATAIREMREILGQSSLDATRRAYALSWVAHLVGDVHQPLHCATRFTRAHPRGDRGGNLFFVAPLRIPHLPAEITNLHGFWDNVLGADMRMTAVKQLAREVERATPPEAPDELDEARWIEESFRYAQSRVYGPLEDQPGVVQLSPGYVADARALALQRAKLAGHRLAALLRHALR